jgi:hypothetical protein
VAADNEHDPEAADSAARVAREFARFYEVTRILDAAQFTRRDVLEVTGLSDAQLKNTLDRNLVRLREQHNPGTGRRRMFTGSDILKIEVAHAMSEIGYPMKWGYLVADEIAQRAVNLLIGLAQSNDHALVTYPISKDDWERIWVSADREKPALPVAYQILEADRLIAEVLAKLNALIAEET